MCCKGGIFSGNIGVAKVSDNQAVSFSKNGDTITFSTIASESYKISTGGIPVNKGDVNSNGSVDIVDALLVAQAYVGLNPSGYIRQMRT